MRSLLAILAVLAIGCGSTTSPTPPPVQAPPVVPVPAPAPPVVIQHANFIYDGSHATLACATGQCYGFTVPIINQGPGCATNVQAIVRFWGGDGTGPQLGPDVPLGMLGESLPDHYFGVGSSVTLSNVGFFDDIRSAHTVFTVALKSQDVACR